MRRDPDQADLERFLAEHGERAPVNACTKAGFLEATGDPGTNWPLLIGRTLACDGYKMAGYAVVDGAETIKITGSRHRGPEEVLAAATGG